MRLFIDTEFTDFVDCHLSSLGMVTECGEEFYVEVPAQIDTADYTKSPV